MNSVLLLLSQVKAEIEKAEAAHAAMAGKASRDNKRMIDMNTREYHKAISNIFAFVDDIRVLYKPDEEARLKAANKIQFPKNENES